MVGMLVWLILLLSGGGVMKIHLSNAELAGVGCRNCVWLLHGQCLHGIVEGESFMPVDRSKECEGICTEYLDFLLSFAEEGDSAAVLWEKFSLYIARLQSLDDYKSFMLEKAKIKGGLANPKERMQAEIKFNTLRLWWERLNDSVMKGYGKIADREGRAKEGSHLPGIMNAKTINFNIENKESKKLEDMSK